MRIEEAMKTFVVSVDANNTVQHAARLMLDRHIGTLPVVDESGRLVGLMTIVGVLHLFMPDFVSLFDELDWVPDFGVLEEIELSTEALDQPVQQVMSEPVSVEARTGLLRAAVTIERHNLPDIPVVDEEDRLVGIASRVDIGTAFLAGWLSEQQARAEAG